MDPRLVAAAENNARWCDLVCRSHGVPTASAPGLWMALQRPPARYPDAVTCAPALADEAVLERIDDGPGCSVKDSFAELDLTSRGFVELFEAVWLFRDAAARRSRAELRWAIVETPDELERWAGAAGLGGTIRPDLLREPTVRILAGHGPDGLGAGAIASRAAGVVGVSNVFAATASLHGVWRDIPAAVADAFPATPLVGYEHGDDLRAALDSGFAAMGPLRVWLRPAG